MRTDRMEPFDYIGLVQALWRNILAIALAAVLFGTAAFAYTAFRIPPTYQATASLYVNGSSFSLGQTNFSVSSADLSLSNSLVSVYLYILQSRTTMEDVIKEAGLTYTPTALSEMISSKGVTGTSAFEVTVTSSNPSEAELIANTIAKILPDRISEIVEGSSVKIVDYAIIPAHRSGPNLMNNTIKGIVAGGLFSALLVALRFLMGSRTKVMIQSADDLRNIYPDIMVLASIPDMRVSDKNNYYSSYYGDPGTKRKGGKESGSKRGA